MSEIIGDNYLTAGKDSDIPFWKTWFYTLDHKRLGVMYLIAVSVFFLVGGLFSILVRTEHLTGSQTIMNAQLYNVSFTLHGAIMIFLFIIPGIAASFGNFLIPLMIGARDVIFPKLNLLSFWLFCIGAIICLVSLAAPVDTGWTFYTPYSIDSQTNVIMITTGVFFLGFSSILTGINFIVTIHKLRAPGMTWNNLPLFCWASYATAIIQVLATPVVGITLVLLIFERWFGLGFFDPAKGGDPVLFQHFFWFYSHPAVYLMILPAMGVVSEVLPVFSRKPIFGYKAIAYSSVGIAVISFLVWGHHMFTSGQSAFMNVVFSVITFLVAIPTAIKVFNWVATMYKGSIELSAAMLHTLAFIFLFTIGGTTGMHMSALATDIYLHDTYFVVAHMHYTMFGGTVFGFFSAVHFWYPKMWGKVFDETKAKIAFVLTFIGFNLTFYPLFVVGTRGMPRRYFNYDPQFEFIHQLSTVGTYILTIGILVMLHTLLRPVSATTERNPYKSKSLEWRTATPPPTLNFDEMPTLEGTTYDYGKET
ncbi:MAG: cytochrome c oxidase subunit I [Spirochaetales bacterium]|nr:cytochrome c oxidase subunit I [Spirochaetales bacterium]|tara:strand:- start:1384 stop:2982 length:1599 start_codon:yes stop_codon:yes gene_type:complete